MGCGRSKPRKPIGGRHGDVFDPVVPGHRPPGRKPSPELPNKDVEVLPREVGSCVIAIDLGTTRSAFAYGFQGNASSTIAVGVPAKSVINEATDIKAETSVLMSKSTKKPVGFGYVGKKTYVDTEAAGLLLFEEFKMGLKDIRTDTDDPEVKDRGGTAMKLSEVMAAALSYLCEHALKQVMSSTRHQNVNAENVEWIITVPAIWSEAANFFMRRAAAKAGMVPDKDCVRLTLVKEPEGACMDYLQRISTGSRGALEDFSVGMQILVLDCGGGTNDMTFIRIDTISPMSYSEVKGPAGGDGGAGKINKSLKTLLEELLGARKFEDMQKLPAMVALMQKWEEQKQGFSGPNDPAFRVDLMRICRTMGVTQAELSSQIVKVNKGRDSSVQLKDDGYFMVLVPGALVQQWFDSVIEGMILRDLMLQLNDAQCKDISVIYLVGGFCSNKYFEDKVQGAIEAFNKAKRRNIRPVLAVNSSIAIVRGAVLAKMHSKRGNRAPGFTSPSPSIRSPSNASETSVSNSVTSPKEFFADDAPTKNSVCLAESYGIVFAPEFDPDRDHGATKHNYGGRYHVHQVVMFAKMGTMIQHNCSTDKKKVTPMPGNGYSVALTLCYLTDPSVGLDEFIYQEDSRVKRKATIKVTFDASKPPEDQVAFAAIQFGYETKVVVTDKDGNPFENPIDKAKGRSGCNASEVVYYND